MPNNLDELFESALFANETAEIQFQAMRRWVEAMRDSSTTQEQIKQALKKAQEPITVTTQLNHKNSSLTVLTHNARYMQSVCLTILDSTSKAATYVDENDNYHLPFYALYEKAVRLEQSCGLSLKTKGVTNNKKDDCLLLYAQLANKGCTYPMQKLKDFGFLELQQQSKQILDSLLTFDKAVDVKYSNKSGDHLDDVCGNRWPGKLLSEVGDFCGKGSDICYKKLLVAMRGPNCELVRQDYEPELEHCENDVRDQYIITENSIWFSNTQKKTLERLSLLEGKKLQDLLSSLDFTKKHRLANEQELELIRSYTGHTLITSQLDYSMSACKELAILAGDEFHGPDTVLRFLLLWDLVFTPQGFATELHKLAASIFSLILDTAPDCDLRMMTQEPSIDDCKKFSTNNQYVLTGKGIWYFDPKKNTLKKLEFRVGRSLEDLSKGLNLTHARLATKQDLELINTCTAHSLPSAEPMLQKQIITTVLTNLEDLSSLEKLKNQLEKKKASKQTKAKSLPEEPPKAPDLKVSDQKKKEEPSAPSPKPEPGKITKAQLSKKSSLYKPLVSSNPLSTAVVQALNKFEKSIKHRPEVLTSFLQGAKQICDEHLDKDNQENYNKRVCTKLSKLAEKKFTHRHHVILRTLVDLVFIPLGFATLGAAFAIKYYLTESPTFFLGKSKTLSQKKTG